jgi:hypothetical protein
MKAWTGWTGRIGQMNKQMGGEQSGPSESNELNRTRTRTETGTRTKRDGRSDASLPGENRQGAQRLRRSRPVLTSPASSGGGGGVNGRGALPRHAAPRSGRMEGGLAIVAITEEGLG